MSEKIISNPRLSTLIVFILFIALAKTIGNMFSGYLFAIILLIATWVLYKSENKKLSELGLDFNVRNISFLPIGFLLGALFFVILFLAHMLKGGVAIELNQNADYSRILMGLLMALPLAIIEEMIFRGYCLKKSMEFIGVYKANILFAFLFMVWHWEALNAWGNYGQMLGLITTGFGHLLFAIALIKSGTLYLPIGIHLGNNWLSRYFFSSQTKGAIDTQQTNDSIFYIVNTNAEFSTPDVITSYLITLIWFILFAVIIWKWADWKFFVTKGKAN